MALKDIQIPKADVSVGAGGSFAVRGLSTADIEYCVRTYGPELRKLWDDFVNGKRKPEEALTEAGFTSIFSQIVREAPALVQGIIGLAADADEADMAVLVKLPITVQIDAITKVAMQTLSVEGEPGKAIETVLAALGSLNAFMGSANAELAKS
ncbi:tail protein [Klebsiella phage YMC16/01/N133_KPN_BP]|uniref:Tail length tape measure protein n=1 Tax=Klebsiella phage YMC16/01/N133_KPN_BP TaxID=2026102 RepID=A0A248XD57_9CAUD|nr:tail protein [Klebsiella phage YMC16/01/N133_KPN_BP]ASW27644.1 tail length tape measure protein [Klebsiella phage YMC16/01/N133_KPN_BP]